MPRETETYDEGYDECGRLIRLKMKQGKAAHYAKQKTKSIPADNVTLIKVERKEKVI